MKCEICHKAEAEEALTLTEQGVEKELYVCHACAAEHRKPRRKQAEKSESSPPDVTIIDGSKAAEAPAFVKDLLKATLGFMEGVAQAEHHDHLVCPVCKTSWQKIAESGRLGCPNCWRAFAKDIPAHFLRGQYALRHQGAMPAHVTGEDTRAYLERELKAAVAREDYRTAAELQRKLAALDAGPGGAS